jgi:PadR family transcriptional regulator PadR
MCGFRRRLLKGSWLQLIVLRILYEKPLHGYGLLKEVNDFMAGRRTLKTGSLYTILRRMEHAGLLASTWEQKSDRLDRRIYSLTHEGVEMLRQGKSMIEEQQKALKELADFYQLHFKEE